MANAAIFEQILSSKFYEKMYGNQSREFVCDLLG